VVQCLLPHPVSWKMYVKTSGWGKNCSEVDWKWKIMFSFRIINLCYEGSAYCCLKLLGFREECFWKMNPERIERFSKRVVTKSTNDVSDSSANGLVPFCFSILSHQKCRYFNLRPFLKTGATVSDFAPGEAFHRTTLPVTIFVPIIECFRSRPSRVKFSLLPLCTHDKFINVPPL
jgi:hypothetical protein